MTQAAEATGIRESNGNSVTARIGQNEIEVISFCGGEANNPSDKTFTLAIFRRSHLAVNTRQGYAVLDEHRQQISLLEIVASGQTHLDSTYETSIILNPGEYSFYLLESNQRPVRALSLNTMCMPRSIVPDNPLENYPETAEVSRD